MPCPADHEDARAIAEAERLAAEAAMTLEGLARHFDLVWEALQAPEDVPVEDARSFVWAARELVRLSLARIEEAGDALDDAP